ncbi:MAG: DUF401 family protein [Nitrospirae bacterium]|nr:DUF401 family protein [Nitrospirota bacterium]
MPLSNILKSLKGTFTNPVTFQLLVSLSFIRMLEMILREHEILKRMMDFIKATLRNKRAVAISMPLLIGIMPSLGGAYFSAPMVAEITKGLNLSPELKAYINYWYRHPWEFFLPLYPGIVLASMISGIPMRSFILMNLSCVIVMLISGIFLGIRQIKGKFERSTSINKNEVLSFVPIIGLILLVIGFNVPLHYALVSVVILLLFFYRKDFTYFKKVFLHGFSIDIILLITGIMLFKETLEVSGAVKNLSIFFGSNHVPVIFILFILPFISGFLTGITAGSVASSFPLLLSIHGVDAFGLSFAFVSGYTGVLLSPVHICLIMTKDYFKADMYGIYKKTIPGVILIFITALAQYLIFRHKIIF